MSEPSNNGGQGVLDARPTRSDLRLYRKAVIGGYNLTPEQRAKIVARASEILEDRPQEQFDNDGNVIGVSYRDQLAAAKVLLACDKMDLEVEKEPAPASLTINGNVQINQGTPLARLLESEQTRDLVARITESASIPVVASDARQQPGGSATLRVAESPPSGNGNGKHH